MKLEQYLEKEGISAADFGKRINVGRMTMHRYLKKGRVPRTDVMKKIREETGGQVTADDFFEADLEAA